MEICVQWVAAAASDSSEDAAMPARDDYVASVSSCAVAVHSRNWSHVGRGETWHACVPTGCVPGLFPLHYLSVHTVRETQPGCHSVVQLCDHIALSKLAPLCVVLAANGMLQMSEASVMQLSALCSVQIRVRMLPCWCEWYRGTHVVYKPPSAIIAADPVPACYSIGTRRHHSERTGLASWASAAYTPYLGASDWRAVLRRFKRQVQMAACLLGYNLEDTLSAQAISEIAAEMLVVPLRAHGNYVVDTRSRHPADQPAAVDTRVRHRHTADRKGHPAAGSCDIPSIPLFEAGVVAYDCEDAAAFAVRSSCELWGLLNLLRVRSSGTDIGLSRMLSESSETVAQCLQLAAGYAPLLLAISQPDDARTVHVMSLLVSRQGLLNLFGKDWQMALAAQRLSGSSLVSRSDKSTLQATARLDSGVNIAPGAKLYASVVADAMPCVVEGCAVMRGCVSEPQKWPHVGHGVPDNTRRFFFGLSEHDDFYGQCKVLGVYGAACGINLEERNMTLLQLLRDIVGKGIVLSEPTKGTLFYYDREIQTLLPGPGFPAECSLQALPTDVPSTAHVSVQMQATDVPPSARAPMQANRATEFRLFDDMPCASLVVHVSQRR